MLSECKNRDEKEIDEKRNRGSTLAVNPGSNSTKRTISVYNKNPNLPC